MTDKSLKLDERTDGSPVEMAELAWQQTPSVDSGIGYLKAVFSASGEDAAQKILDMLLCAQINIKELVSRITDDRSIDSLCAHLQRRMWEAKPEDTTKGLNIIKRLIFLEKNDDAKQILDTLFGAVENVDDILNQIRKDSIFASILAYAESAAIRHEVKKAINKFSDPPAVAPKVEAKEIAENLGDGYGRDRQHVYFNGTPIEIAHPASFVVLREGYAKDGRYLYYNGKKFRNAERADSKEIIPSIFEVLQDGYAKDEKSVYHEGNEITGADPPTFEILGDGRAKDKNYSYHNGKRGNEIQKDLGGGYTKDSAHVYYQGEKIGHADVATFAILKDGYAKDRKNIFYKTGIPERADLKTFQVLRDGYAKDAQDVYYQGQKIPEAKASTFEMLQNGYAKDAKHVYYNGIELFGANPATFVLETDPKNPGVGRDGEKIFHEGKEVLADGYYRDRELVYYKNSSLEKASSITFEVLRDGYARDTKHVFFQGIFLDIGSLDKFEILRDGYARGKNAVYYNGMRIPDAQAHTFEVFKDGYARDENNLFYQGKWERGIRRKTLGGSVYEKDIHYVYYKGIRLGEADPKTFVILGESERGAVYAKDDRHIYYNDKIVNDAENASFITFGGGYAADSNGFFFEGQKFPLSSKPKETKIVAFTEGYALITQSDGHSMVIYKGKILKTTKAPNSFVKTKNGNFSWSKNFGKGYTFYSENSRKYNYKQKTSFDVVFRDTDTLYGSNGEWVTGEIIDK